MMLVMTLKLVLFLIEDLQVNGQTRLYSSGVHSISSKTFDCLYGYIVEGGKEVGKPFIQSSNLIPYCRRLADNEEEEERIDSPTSVGIGSVYEPNRTEPNRTDRFGSWVLKKISVPVRFGFSFFYFGSVRFER